MTELVKRLKEKRDVVAETKILNIKSPQTAYKGLFTYTAFEKVSDKTKPKKKKRDKFTLYPACGKA